MATRKASKSRGASDAEARQQFDPQGRAAGGRAAAAERDTGARGATARASLQLHNGAGVTWDIEVFFNPSSYPFQITGGSIRGTICGSPCWRVTGGSMGQAITINASAGCPGSTSGCAGCATSVTIVGKCVCPPGFVGTYGFNGNSTAFNHVLLFLGYGMQ